MVARITSGSSFYGVIAYNKMKVDDGKGKVISLNRMSYAGRIMAKGEIPLCLHTFDDYTRRNDRVRKPIFHVSLNPHPDDKLNEEQLKEIAEKYMERMGYGNQPYIVYQHNDIDRSHLHIVSTRIDINGSKIEHSFEARKSMEILRDLEMEYNLIHAIKGQETELNDDTKIRRVDYQKGNVKQQVQSVIRNIIANYKFASDKELNTLLNTRNVYVEQIEGSFNDKPYCGVIYGALNDKWERVGTPFKSSLFGQDYGYMKLQKKYQDTKDSIKSNPKLDKTRDAIRCAMKSADTLAGFGQEIAKSKIEVVFRKTDQGRIYGATFIDHDLKIVINGSRLGEEFKARHFNDLFITSDDRQQKEPAERQVEITPVSDERNEIALGASPTSAYEWNDTKTSVNHNLYDRVRAQESEEEVFPMIGLQTYIQVNSFIENTLGLFDAFSISDEESEPDENGELTPALQQKKKNRRRF